LFSRRAAPGELRLLFRPQDFADIIPGHGGLTDRMDCQFLMGLFSALYHSTFIRTVSAVTVAQVLETAVAGLEAGELLELYRRLQRYLLEQGLLEWNALGGLPEDAGDASAAAAAAVRPADRGARQRLVRAESAARGVPSGPRVVGAWSRRHRRPAFPPPPPLPPPPPPPPPPP
ncbi:MAG: hypothetical protein BJ554DRAFT_859, partial [Olpidium bornovanus]